MNNLTPNLSEDQLKQNIDALLRGGMTNDGVQSYVNNYQRSGNGYVLKSQQVQPQPVQQNPISKLGTFTMGNNLDQGALFSTSKQEAQNPGTGIGIAAKTVANVVPDFVRTALGFPISVAGEAANIPSEVANLVKESAPTNNLSDYAKSKLSGNGILPDELKTGGPATGIIPTIANTISNFINAGLEPQTFVKELQAIVPSAAQKIVAGDFSGAAQDIANHPFQQIAPWLLGLDQVAKRFGSNAVDTAITKTADLTRVPQGVQAAETAVKSIPAKIMGTEAPKPENLDQFITEKYNKAIRPGVGSKNTPAQQDIYNQRAAGAVKSIVENKANLTLLDANGDPVELPQTPQQFVDAQQQTKTNIFKQYDAMQQAAGQQGATVDLNPIADQLDEFANNKVVQDNHPAAADYARQQAEMLRQRGSYTTQEAQDSIAARNDRLQAFYRNPNPGDVGKSGVDSLVANNLREGLDQTIENATPDVQGQPGYQDLKNQYGELKTVEKDVLRAAQRQAKSAPSGMIDTLTNISSGAELIRGLLRLNLVDLATSGAIKAFSAFSKYMNSPNRLIKVMFEGADQTINGPK